MRQRQRYGRRQRLRVAYCQRQRPRPEQRIGNGVGFAALWFMHLVSKFDASACTSLIRRVLCRMCWPWKAATWLTHTQKQKKTKLKLALLTFGQMANRSTSSWAGFTARCCCWSQFSVLSPQSFDIDIRLLLGSRLPEICCEGVVRAAGGIYIWISIASQQIKCVCVFLCVFVQLIKLIASAPAH